MKETNPIKERWFEMHSIKPWESILNLYQRLLFSLQKTDYSQVLSYQIFHIKLEGTASQLNYVLPLLFFHFSRQASQRQI